VNLPRGHEIQSVEPSFAAYIPIAQPEQLAPPGAASAEPFGHSLQDCCFSSSANFAAGHRMHEASPFVVEYCPAAHGLQPVTAPALPVNSPFGHTEHQDVLFWGENLPLGHALHFDRPAAAL
jgi:hypothetical protein